MISYDKYKGKCLHLRGGHQRITCKKKKEKEKQKKKVNTYPMAYSKRSKGRGVG